MLKGHLCRDFLHMLIAISPEYSVAHEVGVFKGKSAISIACELQNRGRGFVGLKFWAGGLYLTVGHDEKIIRETSRSKKKMIRELNR